MILLETYIKKLVLVIFMGFALLAAQHVMAAATSTAETIHFRKDCTVDGSALSNCFMDTERAELLDWLHNIRKPNASSPLMIKIGTGQFIRQDLPMTKRYPLYIYCDPASGFTGHINLQGEGRNKTVIGDNSGITLGISACSNMLFKDLTINSTVNSGGAIQWFGGGQSVWQDVDIESVYYGWVTTSDTCGAERGKHYWFNSRISNFGSFQSKAYREDCDESWFFSSEIQNTIAISSLPQSTVFSVGYQGEVHVYGSVIRSNATAQLPAGGTVAAVRVHDGGIMHIHGTGIDLISTAANDVIVFDASSGGQIHANETAYNLNTAAGGSITRIANAGGMVMAPYLWQNAAEVPDITSVTGADMAVVENTTDGHPHLTIYDSTCLSNWFDTTLAVCR